MREKLDMILDNQCMIIGMILKLDEDEDKFEKKDIDMIEMQLARIKVIKDAKCVEDES